MKVALIDDEQGALDELKGYLGRFSEERKCRIETALFHSGDEIVKDYKPVYDVLIFDVSMPGISGLDAAREIRKKDRGVTILFITSLAQYAIEGYEVDAIDYVLKPVTYPDFSMKMRKAMARISKRGNTMIRLETQEGTCLVRVADIRYTEIFGHLLVYHAAGKEEYRVKGSIKDAESLLIPYDFVRNHKSYLVSLRHVKEVRAAEIVVGETVLPLGRAYKKDFMQEFMRFIQGG